MLTAPQLNGCIVAVITPMQEKARSIVIDYDKFLAHIKQLIDAGVSGLLLAGTTGQSATLTHDEHVTIVTMGATIAREYAQEKGRRVLIVASAGSNATHEAVSLSQRIAESVEVDALLHVTGYYNNPPQEGLIRHFETIADLTERLGVPIILYNIPSRTGSCIEPATVIRLARHPAIIGIKEASGRLDAVERIIAETDPEHFTVVSGEDHLVFEIMKRGGRGVISATANRWPLEFQRLCDLCAAGQWERARRLQDALLPCVKAVFAVKNPIPLAAMFSTAVRLPLVSVEQLEEPRRSEVRAAIQTALSITSFPEMTD
ncbi:MAG: 4-hydroxy-tetrahydrodipicolinate synthase [Candidatus Sumerlaeia bacterium]